MRREANFLILITFDQTERTGKSYNSERQTERKNVGDKEGRREKKFKTSK